MPWSRPALPAYPIAASRRVVPEPRAHRPDAADHHQGGPRVRPHRSVGDLPHRHRGAHRQVPGATSLATRATRHFRTGAILTAEGHEVAVGHLTLDTKHANQRLNAVRAAAHYDHTGHVAADVAVGEDSYGVWFSGALRPDIKDTTVRALRSAPLSGDWRRIRGNLELVAVLGVNMPGFPVPRPHGLVASGFQQSLVASGMFPPRPFSSPARPARCPAMTCATSSRWPTASASTRPTPWPARSTSSRPTATCARSPHLERQGSRHRLQLWQEEAAPWAPRRPRRAARRRSSAPT